MFWQSRRLKFTPHKLISMMALLWRHGGFTSCKPEFYIKLSEKYLSMLSGHKNCPVFSQSLSVPVKKRKRLKEDYIVPVFRVPFGKNGHPCRDYASGFGHKLFHGRKRFSA